LSEAPQGVTRSEIFSNIYKPNVEASRIDDALNKLFASGFARKEKETARSGRPTERWFSIKYRKI
jgi:predicted transcriptional regulator